MKKVLIVMGAFLAVCALVSTQSFAQIVILDDSSLNIGTKQIDGIDQLTFKGSSHVDITDADASGTDVPSPGDPFTDVLTFTVTSLQNDSIGTIDQYDDGTFIGPQDFEITGVFDATGVHISQTGDDVDYVFSTATLDLYLELGPPLADKATPGLGGGTTSGYKDEGSAVKIATFVLLTGGGNFDFDTIDGNIDVSFQSTFVLPGIFLTKDGDDFADLTPFVAALTDSNSDALGTALPANWAAYTGQALGTDNFDLDLEVDGSARFGVVPEPTSLLLLGSGLIGLAGAGMRKRRKA